MKAYFEYEDGSFLQYTQKRMGALTKQLCLLAIKKHGSALVAVPYKLRTAKIYTEI